MAAKSAKRARKKCLKQSTAERVDEGKTESSHIRSKRLKRMFSPAITEGSNECQNESQFTSAHKDSTQAVWKSTVKRCVDQFISLFVIWLGNLTSLEDLSIWDCENLEYLPTQDAMKSLTKLKDLTIRTCPLLEERCTKETGPEWPKISHIPKLDYRECYRNAETSTSSRRNAVLDCLPCCILQGRPAMK